MNDNTPLAVTQKVRIVPPRGRVLYLTVDEAKVLAGNLISALLREDDDALEFVTSIWDGDSPDDR